MTGADAGRPMRHVGQLLLAMVIIAVVAAPFLAPNAPDHRFDDLPYAPPTRIHLWNAGLAAPFVHPQRLVSRVERRYEDDGQRAVTLSWFTSGRLVTSTEAPLLVLG